MLILIIYCIITIHKKIKNIFAFERKKESLALLYNLGNFKIMRDQKKGCIRNKCIFDGMKIPEFVMLTVYFVRKVNHERERERENMWK